jgi:hypothetical protein
VVIETTLSRKKDEMSSPASVRTYQHRSLTYHMHPQIATTCPLCRESPAADVATHLNGEDEGIAEPTFAIIKVLHPGWFEGHGACAACWSFYRNLVLLLDASGGFDPRFRIGGRGGNVSVNPNKNDRGSLQFQRAKA